MGHFKMVPTIPLAAGGGRWAGGRHTGGGGYAWGLPRRCISVPENLGSGDTAGDFPGKTDSFVPENHPAGHEYALLGREGLVADPRTCSRVVRVVDLCQNPMWNQCLIPLSGYSKDKIVVALKTPCGRKVNLPPPGADN